MTALKQAGTMHSYDLSVAIGHVISVRTIGAIMAHLHKDGMISSFRRWCGPLHTTTTYWTLTEVRPAVRYRTKPQPKPLRPGRTPEQARIDADNEAWFASLNRRPIWHEARGRV